MIRIHRLSLTFALLLGAIACLAPAAGAQDSTRFAVELEGGAVWQTVNDVQIPNDASGTRISLVDVVGDGPWPAGRVYASWRISARQELRALVAPLSITETGVLGETVQFAGATYEPGIPTEATYKFNSYRISYRYRFHEGDRWRWWIGLTAKIRDARIALEQGATASEKTDVGFVPLLHVAGDWRFAPSWRLGLDADALAGGPGRAEDVALTLGRDLGDAWTLTAGYRTVEGGADVDAVYAFAWLHYAVVGIERRF